MVSHQSEDVVWNCYACLGAIASSSAWHTAVTSVKGGETLAEVVDALTSLLQ